MPDNNKIILEFPATNVEIELGTTITFDNISGFLNSDRVTVDGESLTEKLSAMDSEIDSKADAEATSQALDAKADKANTYTKTQVDNALSGKANASDVEQALALKANTTDVNNALAQKMNKANPVGTGSFSFNRREGSTVGDKSVALGDRTIASGANSFTSGYGSVASGAKSTAMGSGNRASGNSSMAINSSNTASGDYSLAQGGMCEAKEYCSHAEGYSSKASGYVSHAEGQGTIANHISQHTSGEFNIPDDSSNPEYSRGKYVEIVGNGTNASNRSNARTLDWDGNETLAGDVIINGNQSVSSEISRLDGRIDNLPAPMIFKGTLGVGGTIQSLPTASASNEGFTYKVITDGTYAGQTAKVGDVFTSNGSAWVYIPSGDEDNDTWRAIKVNGVEKLGNGISSGSLDVVDTDNIEAEFDNDGNKLKLKTKNIYTQAQVDAIVSDAIYNVLPDDTASGSVANFETGFALPVKSLEVGVNAVQNLNGQSGAYPAGGGVNKFDKDTMLIDDAYINDTNGTQKTNVGDKCTDYIEILPNTAYYIVSEQTTGRWGAWYDENKEFISGINLYGSKTSPANAKYMRLTVVRQGNGNPDTFSVNYPSTDTAYHPYSNICPISGWSEVRLTRCGKNLFKSSNVYNGYPLDSEIVYGDNMRIVYSVCKPNTTYTVSKIQSQRFTVFWSEKQPDEKVAVFDLTTNKSATSISFTTGATAKYICAFVYNSNFDTLTPEAIISSVQIEENTTATTYEAYNGNTVTIVLGGTYYGGHFTQDKDGHRQFEATHGIYTFDGTENFGALSSNNRVYTNVLSDAYIPSLSTEKCVISTHYVGTSQNQAANGTVYKTTGNSALVFQDDTNAVDVATFKAFLTNQYASNTPVTVAYKIATPYVIDLPDGEPIITLNGTNNIYADTGDTDVVFKCSVNDYVSAHSGGNLLGMGGVYLGGAKSGGSEEETNDTEDTER